MNNIIERLAEAAKIYPLIEDQPYSLFVDSLVEIRRLQARVAELYDLIKYAQVDSGVCMCGDDIKDHNQASGHAPVDIWDHAVEQINKEGSSEAFILRKQAEAVQASRQEGEPIGFLQSSGVSQLSGGFHDAVLLGGW